MGNGGRGWIEKLVSFRSLLFQGRKSWERSQQSSSNKRSSPILESNDECTVRVVLQSFKECEFDLFLGGEERFFDYEWTEKLNIWYSTIFP